MNKRKLYYLTLVIAVLLSLVNIAAAPAQAEEDSVTPTIDLDTTLAQSAAEGFLTTLVRPELSEMAEFYLADSVQMGAGWKVNG